MSDRQRQQTPDELEEDFLQALFDEAAEAEGEALQKAFQAELEAGTAPRMPEELDAKYRKWIRTLKRKGKIIQFRKLLGISLKTVAILVLVLIALTSTMVVSVDAIRVPVLNLFVMNKEWKSTIFFSKNQEDHVISMDDKVISTRLPTGYDLKLVQHDENGGAFYHFENDQGAVIQVNILPANAMIDFDTEDVEQTDTKIFDWPAIYIKKSGFRIVWFNSDLNYLFNVYSEALAETDFLEYVYRLAK